MKNKTFSRWAWALAFIPIAAAILWFGVLTPPTVATGTITTITESNFESIAQSKKMLFIEVCTPDVCELERPHLEKVAARYKDRVIFVKIVVGQSPDELYLGTMRLAGMFATQMGATLVEAFPTHIVTNTEGSPVGVRQGLLTAPKLEAYVEEALKAAAGSATAPRK